jgi:hypothetical protein
MDGQRSRRTRDHARRTWYAYYRQVRFARWLGFVEIDFDLGRAFRDPILSGTSMAGAKLEDHIVASR